MNSKWQAMLRSRRFWIAISGVAVAVTEGMGMTIDKEIIQNVVLIAAAWVVGDSIRETH